jgi:hypothetical protein
VEAFTVLRTTGATEDDLAVLASKGFVRILNEDLVSLILDWKRNNLIRSDRYQPSVYAYLLVRLTEGESTVIPVVNQVATDGEPRVGKGSTGEDRVGKNVEASKSPKPTRFSPPSLEDVKEYCQERGNRVDAQRFVDHYSSNGWKVGRNPMRDWKAAVRTWERTEAERSTGARNTGFQTSNPFLEMLQEEGGAP